MPLPPLWKIKRELNVVRSQIFTIPEYFFGKIRQRRYDQSRDKSLVLVECQESLQFDRIAILLIYQPDGVSLSTVITCRHLVAKGYTVLVISNCPIDEHSRERLKPAVWRIVQRPNYGYDFGGYRDGVLLLEEWGICPERLLLINDSIWFPVHAEDTLLDEMERHPADFVGPTLYGDDQANRKRGRQKFLGSFMLLFKTSVLRSTAFASFWRDYCLTNNKELTMRRGERGLSAALEKAGFDPQGIVSRQLFKQKLSELGLHDLVGEVRRLNILDPNIENLCSQFLNEIHTAFPSGVETDCGADIIATHRSRAISLLEQATERPNYVVTAPVFAYSRLGLSYLKKRIDLPLYRQALVMTLREDDARRGPRLFEETRSEIERSLIANGKSIK